MGRRFGLPLNQSFFATKKHVDGRGYRPQLDPNINIWTMARP